jgi:hypothetical protein
MANNDGTISTPDHLKKMATSKDLMEHLVTDHEQKNVPVAKAGQAKLHMGLHAPKPEPEPTKEQDRQERAELTEQAQAEIDQATVAGPLTELEALKAELAALRATPVAAPKAKTYGAPEAKNDLFRLAVRKLDEMVSGLKDEDPILKAIDRSEAARTISQAIHHFATGRDEKGARVWPATTLPKPQRSSWK